MKRNKKYSDRLDEMIAGSVKLADELIINTIRTVVICAQNRDKEAREKSYKEAAEQIERIVREKIMLEQFIKE